MLFAYKELKVEVDQDGDGGWVFRDLSYVGNRGGRVLFHL